MNLLKKCSKEVLFFVLGFSGLLFSFSASSQSDEQCIQVLQRPDRDSGTANQNHCVKRGLGNLCLDVLHSVDIRNVCNREIRIKVDAGKSLMTPGYVGPGKTVYASCEEKRDDCPSISVAVLSENRTDEPQPNRTKSPPVSDELAARLNRASKRALSDGEQNRQADTVKKQISGELNKSRLSAYEKELAIKRQQQAAAAEAERLEWNRKRSEDLARRKRVQQEELEQGRMAEPVIVDRRSEGMPASCASPDQWDWCMSTDKCLDESNQQRYGSRVQSVCLKYCVQACDW
ncbi:MAG: hypothetical protein EOQ86_30300 [Mesorhizobium sp.]|uniref:hypothetical protein n=1 Tax=Mesorhizobium sp. TaxID=1871066 RepID=UPI000FE4E20D|nr:hypothetical protein [Mesorhizobium sp.]RWH69485.1 MAG: hypothetical protein EOQ85_32885 [Mesorhizobium sp.]RWH76351.1 MAG: hypothetical protein EOQ86_30300 [Mesorhizobium sp.]RWH83519.1 MAG: hypothetical protein EOQ87_32700 [Mesorhizobium sp.]RWH91536.1 MAG: hypothetical protein EOQ88_31715 [Mesorhizobium sp.]RWH95809.1 MAG: hypothetical protein EOQ89_30370 [Mesorhizobium sp.]